MGDPVLGDRMPVFVINLVRRPDRREHMQVIGRAAGVDLTFVPAVDAGDAAAVVDLGPPLGVITGRERSRMDYACTSSHRVCWRKIVDDGIAHAIILEDDVLLAPDFARIARTGWIPDDADIVKLETDNNRVHLRNRAWCPSIGRHVGRLSGPHLGAAGYLISRAAAERLWQETVIPPDIIDHILFGRHVSTGAGPIIYQLDPAPVIQGMYHAAHAEADWASSNIEDDRLSRGFTYPKKKSAGVAGANKVRRATLRDLRGTLRRFWQEDVKRTSFRPILFG